ncbi:MAG TPA: MBOAT family O-acyltransferase [Candidatus Binatia bacterium]|nr:MBOAT family O-acyltransferase [Candidatus Binatia bacterium]
MLFLESWFWIFAAAATPLYWLCPIRLRGHWLLIASIVFFYHFAGLTGLTSVLLLGALTYFAGLGIAASRTRWAFVLGCTSLVGALAFYKYAGFFLGNLAIALNMSRLGAPAWMRTWHSPAAPLGISFFTFEFIHYLYEVRVNRREPIRNPVHFAVFAGFFPTLACGPIKRYPDFVPQLQAPRTPDLTEVTAAAQRVILGLFKKVCIADLLVEYVKVFEAAPHFNAPLVATLAVLQGFRIYYDFAGYSDIAIGLAQLVGMRVPENFNRPYFSTTLQEFWRRWHISLSSWIRDYIYIPLGGNRAHRAFNLLAAMLLCGLWHGAAWNFALWGVYHGMGLTIEAGIQRVRPGLFSDGWRHRLLGWAVCYTYVTYGWLLFFYPITTVFKMTSEALRSCGSW